MLFMPRLFLLTILPNSRIKKNMSLTVMTSEIR